MKKIILCGGGTAGHVIPCIALIPELKKHFDEIVYVGSNEGMEKEIVQRENIPFFSINSVKFNRANLLSNFKIPFLLPRYTNQAVSLLKEIKPDVVFSKGGYVSLPVTLACKKLNIPYVIHESDFSMGLANKIVAKDAKTVMTNFEINKGKNYKKFGIPLKSSIFSTKNKDEILKNLNLPKRKTILVTGGSLGAKNLNEKVLQSINSLCKNYNVIHLTGKNNSIKINSFGYIQIPFSSNMGELYKVADVVVSRAGATTLAELDALSKKAVLVPLSSKVSRGDQEKNANYFAKKEGFITILDDELSSEKLIDSITRLMNMTFEKKQNFYLPNENIANELYKIALQNS